MQLNGNNNKRVYKRQNYGQAAASAFEPWCNRCMDASKACSKLITDQPTDHLFVRLMKTSVCGVKKDNVHSNSSKPTKCLCGWRWFMKTAFPSATQWNEIKKEGVAQEETKGKVSQICTKF